MARPAYPRPTPAGAVARWVESSGLTRPLLAGAILTTTSVICGLTLVAWQLLLIDPTRKSIEAWLFDGGGAPRDGNFASSWPERLPRDAASLTASTGGKVVSVTADEFVSRLEARLSQTRGSTFVLYVTGPGVAGDGEYILPAVPGIISEKLGVSFSGDATLSVDHLVSRCRRYPDIQKLIIWDAGQIDSDRDLGVYANPFLHRLEQVLADNRSPNREAPANLAVLVSCSPGQTSWWSDLDGRSVFGHFVERGLTGKIEGGRAVTVQSLARYVSDEVQSWVGRHRGAVQTPVLFSDRPPGEIDFVLRTPRARAIVESDARSVGVVSETPPGAESGSPKGLETKLGANVGPGAGRDPAGTAASPADDEARRTLVALKEGWRRFGLWDQAGGLRRNPRGWLANQQRLSRAERLVLAREFGPAMEVLAGMDFAGPAATEPLSVAELAARGSSDREVEAARRAIATALAELTGSEIEANTTPIAPSAEPSATPSSRRNTTPDTRPRTPGQSGNVPPSGAVAAGSGTARAGEAFPALGAQRPATSDGPGTSPESLPVKVQVEAAKELKSRAPATRTFESLVKNVPVGSPRQLAAELPRYLEAQFPLWAWTFTHSRLDPDVTDAIGPDPEAFLGARGTLLKRAVSIRETAEAVAANDPRVLLWTAPFLEAGDRHRREAQDLLFSADPGCELQAGVALDKATEDYAIAGEVANAITEALTALDRTVASAPGFTQWLYRRSEPGNPEELAVLLASARELARVLANGPDDKPTEVGNTRLSNVRLGTQKLTAAMESLRRTFMAHLKTATRWRDLDALLEVPFVPALVHDAEGTLRPEDERLRLLERLMTVRVAGSLAVGGGDSGLAAPPTIDTRARALATGLARLELDLIAIHPKLPGETEYRDEKINECKATLASLSRSEGIKAEERFRLYAQLSAEVRGMRRSRLDALQSAPSARRVDLFTRDLVVRTLAPSDAKHDESTDPSALLYQNWLVWQANRLLDDFQPVHARTVLALARKTYASPETVRDLDRAETLALRQENASLEFIELPRTLKLSRQERSKPLSLQFRGAADLPEGAASLFVAFDPTSPVAIQVAGSETSLRTGALRAVSGRETVELQAEVSRSGPNTAADDLKVRPGLFFRGHLFPRKTVSLALDVASRPGIAVRLAQSNEALVRDWKDQFSRHPNKGFLHPGTSLGCKMVITHSFDIETFADVRHGFDPARLKSERVKLVPGQSNSDVRFDVQTEIDELSDLKPKFYTVEVEPVTPARAPRETNLAANSKFSDRFPFRMLRPDEIVAIEGMACDGYLTEVFIRHLASDPVCGPVKVKVAIAGHVPGEQKLRPSWIQRWWVILPGLPPEKIEVVISIANKENAIKRFIASGTPPPPPAPPGETEKTPKL